MSKNIFVFAEQRDGELQKVAFELIGKARELADNLDEKVVAVLIGHEVEALSKRLISSGADEVVLIQDEMLAEYVTEPYTKAITAVIKEFDPEIFLYGATAIGRDLAPRVSARIHTGLTADCTGLAIDPESRNLLMTRPAFGGNIMATIVCASHRPQMATVRPGVMQMNKIDTSLEGIVTRFDVHFKETDMNVKILSVVKDVKKVADITEAKILVSGGRGIGRPEKFERLAELADLLGGEVSSTRANVDAGWITKDRQVGQTGKTVRPNLYIACGISGAIQHLAGMEDSDLIIAINKDDTAPIFDVADVGIVGDIDMIIPKLIDAIKKYTAQKCAG
ncbi:MAG: electron transfer flavoprotein subunit alpha/FixB family protein [Christensenellales bacterium]|jgi:electron transfer flavoprotein alpha subunit